jgi:uncharacterized membrane protein (DUF485 family)
VDIKVNSEYSENLLMKHYSFKDVTETVFFFFFFFFYLLASFSMKDS